MPPCTSILPGPSVRELTGGSGQDNGSWIQADQGANAGLPTILSGDFRRVAAIV